MLKAAVVLDAEMSALSVLERAAGNGYWLDVDHPIVQARLQPPLKDSGRSHDELVRMLARDPRLAGAAIRRQWGANILWYARELAEVLQRCVAVPPDMLLIDALNLHEPDSQPVIEWGRGAPLTTGVVMQRGQPVAVSFGTALATTPLAPVPAAEALVTRGLPGAPILPKQAEAQTRDLPGAPALPKQADVQTWPRIDAPPSVPARVPFDVVVGFGHQQQAGVTGAPVRLSAPAGATTVNVTIELTAAEGVEAPEGWSRELVVPLAEPTAAAVTFRLVGTEPTNREGIWLTLLDVRYVIEGTVCGTAARALVVLPAAWTGPPPVRSLGMPWQAAAPPSSPIMLAPDPDAPDLTIEIGDPDGAGAATGHYSCRLYSPHTLNTQRGPFEMRLGDDAKTFARQIVDQVRTYASNALLDSYLEAIGKRVSGRLPRQVFAALREVAAKVAPNPPAVLIVSREPYVPWELAWVEPALDDKRPQYLGAQVLVGRWLRDRDAAEAAAAGEPVVPRPATHPQALLAVKNLAVMAAWYKAETGLKRLPKAEDEAKSLAASHSGLSLDATALAMRQMLTARLERGAQSIGGIEAMHFAGHGDFDSHLPDGSALFLMDGTPLQSTVFGSARYGGERQPLLFLNACMLGIGGEVLGDMGGFPGSSLRGGFGGVLGALWEVDDSVAHDIAIEFWQRALPPPPARGEPVASILRDLRQKYVPDALPAPVSTYLSYVYYGHPRLTLQRV